MRWFDIVGWIGAVGVLAAYATRRPRLYAWANMLLFLPVALPSIIRGAYPGAALNVAFGALGFVALVKGSKP